MKFSKADLIPETAFSPSRADLERLDNGPVSFDHDEELSRAQLARKLKATEDERDVIHREMMDLRYQLAQAKAA